MPSRRRQYDFDDSNAEYAAGAAGYAVGATVGAVSHAAEATGYAVAEGATLAVGATVLLGEAAFGAAGEAAHSAQELGRGAALRMSRAEEAAERAAHEAGKNLMSAEHAAEEGLRHLGTAMGSFFSRAAHSAEEGVHRLGQDAEHAAEHFGRAARRELEAARHEAKRLEEAARKSSEQAMTSMHHAADNMDYLAQHGGEIAEHALETGAEDLGYFLGHGVDSLGGLARRVQDDIDDAREEAHRMGEAFHRGATSTSSRPKHGSTHGAKSSSSRKPVPSQSQASDAGELSEEVTTLHRGAASSAQPGEGRLRITIVSAARLPGGGPSAGNNGGAFCACELRGKPQTRFQTELATGTSDPLWNLQRELAYSAGDALQLTIFGQDRGSDVRLGQASLSTSDLGPSGFNGDLQLGMGGATLRVCVTTISSAAPRTGMPTSAPSVSGPVSSSLPGGLARTTVSSGYPERSLSSATSFAKTEATIRSEVLHGAPAYTGDTQKLKVSIRSARGLASVVATLGAKRDQFYCVVGVPGRPTTRCQSRVSSGAGDPAWNSEHEIPDYYAGDALEFQIVDAQSQSNVVGSCVLSAERFFPYGYDSEMTLSSPGHGICGLLRIKVSVAGEHIRLAPSGGREVPRPVLLSARPVAEPAWAAARTSCSLGGRPLSAASASQLASRPFSASQSLHRALPEAPALLSRHASSSAPIVAPPSSYLTAARSIGQSSGSLTPARSIGHMPMPATVLGVRDLHRPSPTVTPLPTFTERASRQGAAPGGPKGYHLVAVR
mmetsp:Transcript_119432/g.380945  ORF Transcript_119432/g.380945 Transcript_119432/m.380945 type:complete len:778 (-) Transcript_119432:49-2382(-)